MSVKFIGLPRTNKGCRRCSTLAELTGSLFVRERDMGVSEWGERESVTLSPFSVVGKMMGIDENLLLLNDNFPVFAGALMGFESLVKLETIKMSSS
ncbi:hypothetical protein NPIL_692121 [Nephila pilipes]|uniref:Uncharacterized protein n=1 Tax=Nephila pilipes TaxID=299642 RepID=A0A8X6P1A4_NEPPI|nr:hypothetical protein NPIL_692121 [Nephila pilipes]